MDEALNAMLLKTGNPLDVFQAAFTLESFEGCEVHQDDFDYEIFNSEQIKLINQQSDEFKAWASLRIKGRLLLEAYENQILPKITKVYEVQKEIEGRPGVLDAVVELEGYGKVLLDHKTSSRPYKREAVISSTQLALYSEHEGISQIGFVVLVKQINKNKVKTCKKCGYKNSYSNHKTCPQLVDGIRCHGDWKVEVSPEGVVQLMVDEVNPTLKDVIVDAMSQVETAIQSGIYPRNLGACGKMYGRPCPYINYCWQNDKNGLEYKDNENDKKITNKN